MPDFTCAVIDDDADWANLVRRALDRSGLHVTLRSFTAPESALDELRRDPVDVVICDLRMPKLDGFAFTREFRTFSSETPVVIITSDEISDREVRACGATRYVAKRTLNTDLADIVRRLLRA